MKPTNQRTKIKPSERRINSQEELAEVWEKFFENLQTTEREKVREDFEALPEYDVPEAELKREEFEEAVKCMKNGKTMGADKIPAEVWKYSTVTNETLFEFLRKV